MRDFLICLSMLVGLCGLVGCDDGRLPTYQINGKVSFNDNEYPKFGQIEFFNVKHQLNAHGKIQRDGTFSVGTYEANDGAIAGEHQVVIIQTVANHFAAETELPIRHDHGSLVDSSYRDYRSSNLKCVVSEGSNDIELIVRKMPQQTEDGLPVK